MLNWDLNFDILTLSHKFFPFALLQPLKEAVSKVQINVSWVEMHVSNRVSGEGRAASSQLYDTGFEGLNHIGSGVVLEFVTDRIS